MQNYSPEMRYVISYIIIQSKAPLQRLLVQRCW